MGRLDVDAMLNEISSADLARWEAFYSLEPWGAEVEDFRAGTVAATVANYAGRVLKDDVHKAPADFIPSRIPRDDPPSDVDDQVMAIFGPMAGVARG